MRRLSVWRVLLGVAVLAGAALVWLFFFAGGSGEPSSDLTTPTLPESAATTTEPPSGETSTSAPSSTGPIAFVIDQADSTASFEIDEELRGSPNRVVGTTDQVAGQVRVDPTDMSSAVFSQIVINARTFRTDSDRRDQAIRGPIILNSASDEHELITFDVTSVEGLTGSAEVGETVQFTVTGDLTIRGTTNEAVFQVEVTFASDSRIEGTATATVLRTDFGIGIPSVPSVANVGDEVTLKLAFVATAG